MFRALFRMFDYSGRSSRWEYWSFAIGFAVVLILAGAFVANYQNTHLGLEPQLDDGSAAVVTLLLIPLVVMPSLALKVRRYHDFGWSGWAVLWMFVPFINLFMEFMLLFRGPLDVAVADHEPRNITIYNTPATGTHPPTTPTSAHVDQIARLAEMHAQGVLTAQEFSTAKARLLRS